MDNSSYSETFLPSPPTPLPQAREGLKSQIFPFPSLRGEGAGVRGTVSIRTIFLIFVLIVFGLTACQSTNPPPGPTIIPTTTETLAPSSTLASPTLSDLPQPTLAPIITATSNAPISTNAPIALAP